MKTSCVDVGPTQSQSQPSQCDEPGPDTAPSTIAGMFDSCMRSSRAAMAGKAKDKVPDDLSIFDEVRDCRTKLDEEYPGWSSPLKQLAIAALAIYQLRR